MPNPGDSGWFVLDGQQNSYATGSLTILDGRFMIVAGEITLDATQSLTINGTGRVVIL